MKRSGIKVGDLLLQVTGERHQRSVDLLEVVAVDAKPVHPVNPAEHVYRRPGYRWGSDVGVVFCEPFLDTFPADPAAARRRTVHNYSWTNVLRGYFTYEQALREGARRWTHHGAMAGREVLWAQNPRVDRVVSWDDHVSLTFAGCYDDDAARLVKIVGWHASRPEGLDLLGGPLDGAGGIEVVDADGQHWWIERTSHLLYDANQINLHRSRVSSRAKAAERARRVEAVKARLDGLLRECGISTADWSMAFASDGKGGLIEEPRLSLGLGGIVALLAAPEHARQELLDLLEGNVALEALGGAPAWKALIEQGSPQ